MNVVTRLRSTSARRRADRQLDRNLAEFRSPGELSDLAALLDRYPDADADPIRERVRWTAA